MEGNTNWNNFSNADDGPLPCQSSDNDVYIPEFELNLTNKQLEQPEGTIDPLIDDGTHGCNIYMGALNVISEFENIGTADE